MASRLSQQADFPNDPTEYPVVNPFALGNVRTNETGSAFQIPVIILGTANASLATANIITPIVLPKGVYQITASIEVGASVISGITETVISIPTSANHKIEFLTSTTVYLFISASFVSDGTTALSITCSCGTSSGTWSINAVQADHFLQVVRIA